MKKKRDISYFVILAVGLIVILLISAAVIFNLQATIEDSQDNKLEGISIFINRITINPEEQFQEFRDRDDKMELMKKSVFLFLILGLIYFQIIENSRKGKYHKVEKGSAKWGTAKDRKKYFLNKITDDKTKENNLILSNTEFLPVNVNKIFRNLNVLVIGGSGAGKTRYYVKPNIAQANTNFIITDPKGELHRTTSYLLEKEGYTIKTLNLVVPKYSHNYNPFNYVNSEMDISILVDSIIKNTEEKNKKGGDGFWLKAETALLKALMYYIYYFEDDKNMYKIFEMIVSSKEKDDEDSALTEKFEKIEDTHVAKRYYNVFLQAPKETRKSILISLGVRMAVFGSNEMNELLSTDNINLDNVEEKVAIYVIISDSSSAFNVVASMFFTQAFQRLYFLADNKYKGALPIHWQIMLDEFANIGQIPDFPKLISTMRGRSISVTPIIQSKAQLEQLYDKDADTIIGNCDVVLYLGGNDLKTAEEISKKLGKTTIVVKQKSKSRGKNGSSSISDNVSARELMMPDELLSLDNEKLIIMIRGINPFFSDKYDLTKHPKYDFLENKNNFIEFDERAAQINIFKKDEINEIQEEIFIDFENIDLQEEMI